MTTVLLFGTFDLLHDGHRDLFRQAREYGNKLHIILARDATVLEVKGRAPHFSEVERKAHLEQDPLVDTVQLGSLTDKYAALRDIAPEVIMLGYDQEVFVDKLAGKLASWNLHPAIVRATPYNPEVCKSSLLRRQLED